MSTPQGWSRVFSGNRLEADIVVAALETHGLHPQSLGGVGEYLAINFYDSLVFVPEEEEGRARELIDEIDKRS